MRFLLFMLIVVGGLYLVILFLLAWTGERLVVALRWPLDLWAMRKLPDEKDDL